MKQSVIRLLGIWVLLCSATSSYAVDYVSVSAATAVLYDAPSDQAKKLFIVNRYLPLEVVITLDKWVKVRDRSGGLYWIEKQALSNQRYVFALAPLVDVRKQPDASSEAICQVRQQVVLQWLESTGAGWIKVRHQDGEVGYVRNTDVWGG